jgi:AAA domain
MPPQLSREPHRLSLEQEKLRILVYGDPGVGKSYLALTAPRPFVVDTDAGLITGAIAGFDAFVQEPTGWRDLEALYFWCKERRDTFDTIVFDSITTLQRLLLDEIVDATGEVKTPERPVMQFVPEQGMYLANQRQVARILTEFRRLGKHMVVTAGVRQRLTAEGLPIGKRSPEVAPGLLTILNHWSSVVGELTVRTRDKDGKELAEPVRALLTAPSSDRTTKSRFAKLLPYVINPNFEKLWKLVEEEYAEAIAKQAAKQAGAAGAIPKPDKATA